ncbi:MAG: hypothetical protein ACXU82_11405 [Caulobacteraceae bacterium]
MDSRKPLLALAAVGAVSALAGAAHARTPIQDPTPPTLWSMQTKAADGQSKTIVICVDKAMKAGFQHSIPEVNGRPCVLRGRRPVLKGELFAARCRAGDELFQVHSVSSGDLTRDFTVDTTIETDARGGARFEQQIRYRKVSQTCPKDWRMGDSGAPGDTKLLNALTGAARKLAEPIASYQP